MSEDGYKRFIKLEELSGNSDGDEDIEICSQGFTLGALIILEVLEKKDTIINK